MSQFNRASDNKTPSYLHDAFFGGGVELDEPSDDWEELKKNKSERSRKIASMAGDLENDIPIRDWDKSNMPAVYRQPQLLDKEVYSDIDMSGRSIRRASQGIESQYETRIAGEDNTFFMTPMDAMRIIQQNGASIFDPYMDKIQAEFQKSAERENVMFAKKTANELRADRHGEWQEAKHNELTQNGRFRPEMLVLSRANPLTRISSDMNVSSRFNLPDYDSMEKHEIEKNKLRTASRERKLQIKRTQVNRKDDWESSLEDKMSPVYAESQAGDWLEKYFKTISDE